MAKITRYNGNLKAFASESQGTERTIYGDVTQSNDLTANINADYLRGLAAGLDAAGQPTEEDFNGALFTVSQLSAYLHQMGVAEWTGLQEYHVGSIVNRAGVLYTCKKNNLVSATAPESDSTNWGKTGSGDFVALTGNQTIAGTKTFSSSPVAPTPAVGTRSNAVATTNFVAESNKVRYWEGGVSKAYNTAYLASKNVALSVLVEGSFMNGIDIAVGSTADTITKVIGQFGDDLNNSTKLASMWVLIPAGMYYKVRPKGGHGFETVVIIEYPFGE